MSIGTYKPIQIVPGFNKNDTELNAIQYVDGNNVRFVNKALEKIGGWSSIAGTGSATISGCPRWLFNYTFTSGTQQYHTIIGTHQKLYTLVGNDVTNITPPSPTTTAIANSVDTDYDTLGTDPFTTTISSTTVTVAHTAHGLSTNDTVTISGVSGAVNGVPDTEFNTQHNIGNITTNTYDIVVSTSATSSGTGGGSVVKVGTAYVTINYTAHPFAVGDRVLIAAATATGGIPASEINDEHVIDSIDTNDFVIVVSSNATSSVSAGGGASTTIQAEIADGECDASSGFGFGMGLFGTGNFGVAKTGTGTILPRIWSGDRFGNNVVMTPGLGTGLYEWDGITSTAPALVSNAPTAINWAFVTNDIVVTFGADSVDNRVKWSGQGDNTVWTALPTNVSGSDDIEGAERFVSNIPVDGANLLMTESQVWFFKYVGKPSIFAFRQIPAPDGIIAPRAGASGNNFAVWMGQNDFYIYTGGTVQAIPQNSIKDHVFDRLDRAQKGKCFCWQNTEYNEFWFFYPSTDGSGEIDSCAVWGADDGVWWDLDDLDRTAAEQQSLFTFPRLINSTGTVYEHESGKDDDGTALSWYAWTSYFMPDSGNRLINIKGMQHDAVMTNDASLTVETKLSPQSTTSRTFGPYTMDADAAAVYNKVDFRATGRLFRYKFSGSALGDDFRIGNVMQDLQLSGGR